MKPSEIKTIAAMNRFGGNFVKALCNLMIVADDNNRERIEKAFPEIFARYIKMAEDLEAYDKEDAK